MKVEKIIRQQQNISFVNQNFLQQSFKPFFSTHLSLTPPHGLTKTRDLKFKTNLGDG